MTDCEFSKPNPVTIDKKPRLCNLPGYSGSCAYQNNIEYCEVRWFKLKRDADNRREKST